MSREWLYPLPHLGRTLFTLLLEEQRIIEELTQAEMFGLTQMVRRLLSDNKRR
jgi:hypothetical protein